MPRPALRVALSLLALALLGLPAAPQPSAAAPGPAQAITVSIFAPLLGYGDSGRAGTTFCILAQVSSTFEVVSVVATVEDRSVTLGRETCSTGTNQDPPGVYGVLSTAGLSYGMKTLTVTATDILGNTAQATRQIMHNLPPALTVDSPPDQAVARPELPIRLTCADDNPAGCAETSVSRYLDRWSEDRLLTSTGSISRSLSLAGFEGQQLILSLRARDSEGYDPNAHRTIYVDSSPNSVERLSVDGRILDADLTRVLSVRFHPNGLAAGHPNLFVRAVDALLLYDRATGQTTTITDTISGVEPITAKLTASGVVFASGPESLIYGTSTLYGWRDGTITELGEGGEQFTSPNKILVAGDYVVWPSGDTLVRADIAGSTVVSVTADFGSPAYDVAANGDVVFLDTAGALRRYRDATLTTLVAPDSYTRGVPQIDGDGIYYNRCASTSCDLVRFDTDETVVFSGSGAVYNNGWIAFTRTGPGGGQQIWRRWPDGREERISLLAIASAIDDLGPDGTIVFGSNRYISRPGQPPVQISTNPESKVYLYDGVVERSLGRTLFSAQIQRLSLPLLSR